MGATAITLGKGIQAIWSPWSAVEPAFQGTVVSEPLSLSPQGASEYLSLSKPTIYRLLAAGTIKGKRAGTRTMIDGASLRAYVASLPDYVPGAAIPCAPHLQKPRKRAGTIFRGQIPRRIVSHRLSDRKIRDRLEQKKTPGSFLPGALLETCQTLGIRSFAERER